MYKEKYVENTVEGLKCLYLIKKTYTFLKVLNNDISFAEYMR